MIAFLEHISEQGSPISILGWEGALQHLGAGTHERQWRTQFMAGIRHKRLLPPPGLLCWYDGASSQPENNLLAD
jgi:hypothetical protein